MISLKSRKFNRRLNLVLGFVSLILAYLGVALPGFPGTPFILLTAFFFTRSSDRMYNWLLSKKIFAKIIHQFSEKEKLPLKFKLFVIVQLWISITVAIIWFVKAPLGQAIFVIIGVICTVLLLATKKIKLRP